MLAELILERDDFVEVRSRLGRESYAAPNRIARPRGHREPHGSRYLSTGACPRPRRIRAQTAEAVTAPKFPGAASAWRFRAEAVSPVEDSSLSRAAIRRCDLCLVPVLALAQDAHHHNRHG